MSKAQLDMFATQADLLAAAPVSYAPDPERIRAKLANVLSQLRGAATMPWDSKTERYQQQVFPQMASALPPDEAARLRLEFDDQIRRLRAAC